MRIIIEVLDDINLVPTEKRSISAFIRRLGFKVVSVKEEE